MKILLTRAETVAVAERFKKVLNSVKDTAKDPIVKAIELFVENADKFQLEELIPSKELIAVAERFGETGAGGDLLKSAAGESLLSTLEVVNKPSEELTDEDILSVSKIVGGFAILGAAVSAFLGGTFYMAMLMDDLEDEAPVNKIKNITVTDDGWSIEV